MAYEILEMKVDIGKAEDSVNWKKKIKFLSFD